MKLKLITLAAAILSSQAAAQSLTCVANAAGSPTARANGLWEKAGDVLLICNGGTPTPAGIPVPTVDITVSLAPAVNITSRNLAGNASEALLTVDEPTPANQQACAAGTVCGIDGTAAGVNYAIPSAPSNGGQPVRNVYQANAANGATITIAGVPFDPPGPAAIRILRIANLFFNASQLNVPAGAPVPLNATVTSTGGVNLNIQTFFPLMLALAMDPAQVLLLDAGGQPSGPVALSASAGNNVALASSPHAGVAQDGVTFHARLRERQPGVLRIRNGSNWPSPDVEPPLAPQAVTGALSFTETAFYNPAFPPSGGLNTAGLASRGTRIVIRFGVVPSGVKLYAPIRIAGSLALRMVTAPPSGDTGSSFAPTAATSKAGGGIAPLAGCPSACYAVYEVTSASATAIENADIPVYVAYRPHSAPGSVAFTAGLGAISTQGSAAAAVAPRFAPAAGPPIVAVQIQ